MNSLLISTCVHTVYRLPTVSSCHQVHGLSSLCILSSIVHIEGLRIADESTGWSLSCKKRAFWLQALDTCSFSLGHEHI